MEYNTINQLFPLEITKIQSALHAIADPRINTNRLQEVLEKTLNSLGEQSSKAQALTKVITNSEKLRASDHWVYLLKDATANNGNGEFIGYIKVGHKHLFMFDHQSKMYELEPLCILDFFVLHEYQRSGKGKLLFDFMLNDTKTQVHELAIDGPSIKMEKFMQKNYGIYHLIRQSNNFAISPRFFENQTSKRSERTAPPAAAVQSIGRFAARKQHSSVGNIIHGDGGGCRDRDNGDSETQTENLTPEEYQNPDGRIEPGAQPGILTISGNHNLSVDRPRNPSASLLPTAHASSDSLMPSAHASSNNGLSARTSPTLTPTAHAAPVLFPSNCIPPATLSATACTRPAAGLPLLPGRQNTAGLATPRETDDPKQITKRGHLDMKFYHNKLW